MWKEDRLSQVGTGHRLSVLWSWWALVPASTAMPQGPASGLGLHPSLLLSFLPIEVACLLLVKHRLALVWTRPRVSTTYLSHFCLNDESQTTDLTPNLLLPLSSISTSLNGYLNLLVTYTDSVGHLRSSLHDIATFKHLLTHVSKFLCLHPNHLDGDSYHIIGLDPFRRRTWRYHPPSSTQWLLSARCPSGEAHLCQQPSILLILLNTNV